jgi:hypothetical protein
MSQFNAPTYEITRSLGQCVFTGRTLEPGEAYISTLVEVDPSQEPAPAANALGFKRLDVSMEAWQQGHRPDRLFSHWKSIVPEPNQKKKLFVDDEVLMGLLKRLADADQPQRIAFRFVLALILMRKKLVRYDGMEKRSETVTAQGEDGAPASTQQITREWWLMTPKLDVAKGQFGKWNEEERIEVLDPHLDETQIQQVTSQLNEILDAEL